MGRIHQPVLWRVEAGEQLLLWRLHRYVLIRFRGAFSRSETREIVQTGLATARRAANDQYPPLDRLFAIVDDVALERRTKWADAAPVAVDFTATDDDQLAGKLFGEHADAEMIRTALRRWVIAERRAEVRIITQYLDLADRADGQIPSFDEVAHALSLAGAPVEVCVVRAAVFRFRDLLLVSR